MGSSRKRTARRTAAFSRTGPRRGEHPRKYGPPRSFVDHSPFLNAGIREGVDIEGLITGHRLTLPARGVTGRGIRVRFPARETPGYRARKKGGPPPADTACQWSTIANGCQAGSETFFNTS